MPKTEVGAKAAGLNHRHGMTDATPIIVGNRGTPSSRLPSFRGMAKVYIALFNMAYLAVWYDDE